MQIIITLIATISCLITDIEKPFLLKSVLSTSYLTFNNSSKHLVFNMKKRPNKQFMVAQHTPGELKKLIFNGKSVKLLSDNRNISLNKNDGNDIKVEFIVTSNNNIHLKIGKNHCLGNSNNHLKIVRCNKKSAEFTIEAGPSKTSENKNNHQGEQRSLASKRRNYLAKHKPKNDDDDGDESSENESNQFSSDVEEDSQKTRKKHNSKLTATELFPGLDFSDNEDSEGYEEDSENLNSENNFY